nr:hypothetical protein [Corallococcus exiguus]
MGVSIQALIHANPGAEGLAQGSGKSISVEQQLPP